MADKYLNLAGTKKIYDDLRARMVESGGKVEGLESTKARTITSADVKPEYRAQWDHLTTQKGGEPIDNNWIEFTNFNFVHPEAHITAIGSNGKGTIIVANDQNELSASTDYGKSFKTVVNPYSNDKYTRILYENGIFIAIPYSTDINGSSNTAWSTNGLTWFQGDYHDEGYHFTAPKDFVHGPDFDIAVGTKGGIMKGNINGMNFKHTGITYNGAHQDKTFYCVATAAGMWLACGEQGTIIYSADGLNWQDFVPGAWGTNDDILFMALHNGNPYLADRSGHVKLFNLGTQPPSFNPVNTGLGNEEITYFDNINGMLIAGTVTGKIAYSKNGSNWTTVSNTFNGPIQQITYDGQNYWNVTPTKGNKCSTATVSELVKFLSNVNGKLTVPEKYQPLSLWTKARGTFNDRNGGIHEIGTMRCFDHIVQITAEDQTRIEDDINNKAGYNLTIDNLVLDLEPTVIIGNLVNENNLNKDYGRDISYLNKEISKIRGSLDNKVDNSALNAVVEQVTQLLGTKADKSYVDGLIGPINTTLDEINGEVL